MASEIVRSQTETVTEQLHHGHFSLQDNTINIAGLSMEMSEATYNAIKAQIISKVDEEKVKPDTKIVSVTIDDFKATEIQPK